MVPFFWAVSLMVSAALAAVAMNASVGVCVVVIFGLCSVGA